MANIQNIAIFMSDSIRWDSHPETVNQMGTTVRTIASSLHTPTSITSILTGRYLPRHGVRGFTDQIDGELPTLLDCVPNSGLSAESGSFNEEIYGTLLEQYGQQSLEDISTPFAWFMRDPGGHAPYDRFSDQLAPEITVHEFFDQHAGDSESLETLYHQSIRSSVERFKEYVLGPLEDRGLLDETLVVFVSDHGELLGEYGHAGQSFPACPEIVYVPMTFIHPNLPDIETDLARHIDLTPTVLQQLHDDAKSDVTMERDGVEGKNLFDQKTSINYGLSLYYRAFPSFNGEFSYRIDSVWDRNGGHVFNRSGMWPKSKLLLGYLTRIPAGKQLRRDRSLEGIRLVLEPYHEWGSPDLSINEAERILDDLESLHLKELEISEETREHLDEMGYL